MGFQFRSYLTFLWRSFHLHGVHSPFVYALDSLCLNDKKQHDFYKNLQVFKNYLLENEVKLHHESFEKSKLLYRLVNHLKIENVLELGYSNGMETFAMAGGNTENILVASKRAFPKVTTQYFTQNGIKKIAKEGVPPALFLDNIIPNTTYDLVFFHENNSVANTFSLFKKASPLAHNDTVFIFEKIHDSKENEQLWKNIQQHKKVKVTVDTFYFGFVFFRKEQTKEHFVV